MEEKAGELYQLMLMYKVEHKVEIWNTRQSILKI